MSITLPLLSPLVTRVLELTGFPPELKTRDIQAVFVEWENDKGGFKIKWVDDTKCMIVFNDPSTAKRAYLSTLQSPPPSLMTSAGVYAKIRPYDGSDASQIIQSVSNRPRSRSNASAQGATPAYHGSVGDGSPRKDNSVGRSWGRTHARSPSGSNPSSLPPKPVAAAIFDASYSSSPSSIPPQANSGLSPFSSSAPSGLEPVPPSPNPTGSPGPISRSSSPSDATATGNAQTGPTTRNQLGDPAKRLVAGALGVKHPALSNPPTPPGASGSNGGSNGVEEVQRAVGEMKIEA